jgi:hypothetical protein
MKKHNKCGREDHKKPLKLHNSSVSKFMIAMPDKELKSQL